MRIRYLVGVCLILALAATGCKNEPEPIPEESVTVNSVSKEVTPEKTVTEQPVREKPALEEPVREKVSAEQPLPEEAASDETEYFAVFMEGKKVGHAIQTRVVDDEKVTTSEEASITISRADVPITINMTETSIETADGKPLGFKVAQDMSIMTMNVEGTLDANGIVNVTTESMGTEQKSTLEWPSGAVMAEGLRLLTLSKGLKEGSTYTVKIFSPGILQALEAQIQIGPKQNVDLLGRVVSLTEVTTTLNIPGAGEIVSKTYVDENLRTQKNVMPVAGLNVEMVACAKEFALGENDVLELVDKMFVRSPEPLRNLASVKSITYDLIPTGDASNLTIPSNDNQKSQRLSNGKVVVTIEPVAAPPGVRFPYSGSDQTILEATKPTRFLQSDRKEIIELARSAVGQTKDAAEAIKKIEAFVGDYIENTSLSVGYASAAEVAASKQGDCSEFAVLTAAMCRAVGIPAQVVVGVAYVEDFAGLQGFGGHAWNQAYVGGKWVGLDAAFKGTGRGGYDAGHIALAAGNGEPADFLNMASTLGQFKIEKVTVSRK
ncbi:MAG: transglutaminase-like domain-containing protein [Phycisphaerae bacterium]|nr:transglutaminase-like domain-containing protein [Phycisphaerae bacterium]